MSEPNHKPFRWHFDNLQWDGMLAPRMRRLRRRNRWAVSRGVAPSDTRAVNRHAFLQHYAFGADPGEAIANAKRKRFGLIQLRSSPEA